MRNGRGAISVWVVGVRLASTALPSMTQRSSGPQQSISPLQVLTLQSALAVLCDSGWLDRRAS